MKRMLKGFTLVEIMIVVAIIAILAAVAIPNFIRYRKTAQMNACISNLKQLQAACEQARMGLLVQTSILRLCRHALVVENIQHQLTKRPIQLVPCRQIRNTRISCKWLDGVTS